MIRSLVHVMLIAGIACSASSGSAQLFERTDRQREIEVGREVAREIERTTPLSRDPALQERVRRIGSALIENLPERAYSYEFKVLAVSDFNAFALPGGFVYVNEGLLTRLSDDNAIAFVMAHEIAHASRRHWHQQMEKMKTVNTLALVLGLGTGQPGITALAAAVVARRYSRAHETEADQTGLEYLWAAGFDLHGAIEAAEMIAKLDKKGGSRYLRSHPRGEDRLKRIQVLCATLQARPRPHLSRDAVLPAPADVDTKALFGTLPAEEPAPNPWFPMAVGNTWTYAVTGGGGQSHMVLRIVSEMRLGSGAVYRAETAFGKDVRVPCQLMTTATELWRRNDPTSPTSSWRLDCLLALPDGIPRDRDGKIYTLLEPAPLTIPCGHFENILKIRQQAGPNTYELWFARAIGLIQRACVETGITETLVSYKVDKGEPVSGGIALQSP